MSLTLDTSHFEISPRKYFASENMRLISVTLDTSHSPIDLCGPLAQSAFRSGGFKKKAPGLMQVLTALLSSTLDRAKNAAVACMSVHAREVCAVEVAGGQ